VRVTLLDRRNHHLFQPLLYQVATAALNASDIAAPLRSVLRKADNVTVLLAPVERVDLAAHRLVLDRGEIGYDALVLAAGASHSYFGHEEWEVFAPGLKTLEDALEIRRRVLLAYEAAERERDGAEQRALLTFVVIGGGPTGVELAGALGEISRQTIARDFRLIDPTKARIVLLEGGAHLLSAFPESLSRSAVDALRRIGVEVRTTAIVTRVTADAVWLGGEHRAVGRGCGRGAARPVRAFPRRAGSLDPRSSRGLRHRRHVRVPAPDRSGAARRGAGSHPAGALSRRARRGATVFRGVSLCRGAPVANA
jgi:NADH dehydrogenase